MRTTLPLLITTIAIFNVSMVFSQGVGIGTTSFTPVSDALLELRSTSSGFLMPRMTEAQREAIASPSDGLMVYQTDGVSGYYFHNGVAWSPLGGDDLGNHSASSKLVMNNNVISNSSGGDGIRISDAGNVGIGPGAGPPSSKLELTGGDLSLVAVGGNASGVRFNNPANSFGSTIKAGAQTASINYTLPTAAPVANGAVLASTTTGVMSWDSFLKPTMVTASANTTLNPANYNAGNVSGMSVASVPAGTYLVTFNADMSRSGSSACQCVVRAGGTDVSDTERRFEIPSTGASVYTLVGKVTMAATGTIEIRCQKTSGGSGFIVGKRSLTIQSSN